MDSGQTGSPRARRAVRVLRTGTPKTSARAVLRPRATLRLGGLMEFVEAAGPDLGGGGMPATTHTRTSEQDRGLRRARMRVSEVRA